MPLAVRAPAGKLVDGHKLLAFLEDFDTKNERPLADLVIAAAGKVLPFTSPGVESDFYANEDEAAARLQSMHKARKVRQEQAERKQAAARIAAVKRGQKARQEVEEQKKAAVKMQAIQRGRNSRKK